jgi:Na+-transporting NADH:ubiquinone oxidoreductase subunit A
VVISLQDTGAPDVGFAPLTPRQIKTLDRDQVAERLLNSGLWTAFRTRPFSRVPLSDSHPRAIFVTAIDTRPLAADPAAVVARDTEHFALGLTVLTRLTAGTVWLCTGPAWAIALPDIDRVQHAAFGGPHPAGLPGTHMHFLEPVGPARIN